MQTQQLAAGGDQLRFTSGMPNFAELKDATPQVRRQHHLGAARQRVDSRDERFPRRPLGEADTAAGNRDHLSGGEGLQIHPWHRNCHRPR